MDSEPDNTLSPGDAKHLENLSANQLQSEYFEALHRMAVGLMRRRDLDSLLEEITVRAAGLLRTPNAFLYILTDDGEAMEMRVGVGFHRSQLGARRRPGEGFVGKVWQEGAFAAEQRIWQDGPDGEGPAHGRSSVAGTILGLPLRNDRQVIGVLGFNIMAESYLPAAEEKALLQRLAELSFIAVSNLRLYTKLQTELAERTRAEAALRESEASYRTLAENLPGIVYRVFLRENDRVRFFNTMLQSLTGYAPQELPTGGPCPLGEIVLAADRVRVEAACVGAIAEGRPFEVEYGITHKNGGVRTVVERARPVSGADGRPLYVEGVIMDITAQKGVQDKLLYISTRDGLTSLYNRAYFEAALDRHEQAGDGPVGIIICDINGLKLINDAMGHHVGDTMLIAAAKIIKQAFRREDIVARIGGDEYAVLMPGATGRAVEAACRRVHSGIAAYNQNQPGVHLSLSVGHAIGQPGESIRALLREADNNMYREKLNHSHRARSAIIQTAMKLLEERDFLTEEHVERIDRLVSRLARGLGLPAFAVAGMQLLAKFHDIGKVGIPDNILRKAGPLTAEEQAAMRRHCEIGYRIAQSSGELLPIAELILKHHEWWNGDGYPVGLSGEQIPRECRILAVVEAYDAMTSDRPYRKAMTHEAAVAEIKRCAGTQFDPAIVRKFLRQLGSRGAADRPH